MSSNQDGRSGSFIRGSKTDKAMRSLIETYMSVFQRHDGKSVEVITHLYPKTATTVMHLPDLSFGLRIQTRTDNLGFFPRGKSIKRLHDASDFPEEFSTALSVFSKMSDKLSLTQSYYEKADAFLVVAVGVITFQHTYEVSVEMAMAKDDRPVFRND